ncbi:non-ribosomal peptide synthetase [Nostoc sp. NMS8]|uniref:non-ribosomal peptide synthetase n=1 Tax=Nostoc sp. NMS8 TaxID=2815392 RepID=UPI0025D3EDB0|nr:non-ribosomal peptide synthetase [Nostoc sp. NMS8]MBN3958479.1 amino acid adenylation domain-containing protein [Nostoc sp. NMS8]
MQETIQGFPLSPQQKHLWLLQQGSNLYISQCAILIEGNVEVNILEEALNKVIARNEILHTNFHRPRGLKIPIQVIKSSINVFLSEYFLENNSYQEEKIEALLEKRREQSINLQEGQLLKVELVKCSSRKYVLVINVPSLCADSKSLKNLVNEISQYYAACLQNTELDEEPLQYADIATWQNELLEAEETTTSKNYWQQVDFSTLDTLKLPFENCLSKKSEFEPQFIKLAINNDLLIKIEEIVQKYQISIDTFFLTCWQIILCRLTGQSNLIIGLGCDGRNYEELKAALGLFAKYLPLVCNLKENDTFSDVLIQVNTLTDEILEWQDSFSWDVFSKTNADDIEESFLPFCFDFEEIATNYYTPEVSFSIHQHYVCFDRFKLKLSCVHTQNGVKLEFHYDAKLFHKEDIQRLVNEWETLLISVINNPSTAISRLDILSEQERQELLVTFNNTKTAELQYECIHHWFEQQCDRTPDNIAIVYTNQRLTYRELNTRANQLAHYLQQLGVKPDVTVGLCVERSPLMLIGLLAILKAGGAYVPIDPSYPLERKTFILNDSQMPVLLTQRHLITDLATNEIQVICIDSDWQAINQQEITNPITTTSELNLAYVIYTSGSTGKPKGTLITHQGLVNYLSWCTQTYLVQEGVGTLVHSPLGFDLTITSIFSPLLVGRTVELLSEEQGIETLSQALKKSSNLSLVKITPAHLDLLKQQLSKEEIANKTRAFIIGGENLLAQSLTFWQDVAPETILVNEYGPTETVVGCCVYQVPVGKHYTGSIPIGKAIANTQLYILDEYLQPVPKGVPGELHIGGFGLARGYLNQAELTALKFIPNPFSNKEGDRLYKTGDITRYLPSGDIEYISRIDNQIKIRGFRIELGEIEAVISQHPVVRETVVIVSEESVNYQRIIAYIVIQKNQTLAIPELRSFLESKLPSYMLPSAFVILEALPLTSNGKVDRKALPAPEETDVSSSNIVPPSTLIENLLASIWTEVLGLDKVGINNNFFTLGGHSLMATRVMSQIRQVFKVELPLPYLFEKPTIAELAKEIEKAIKVDSGAEATNIERIVRSHQLPLSFAQQRLWFLAQLEPDSPFYNTPAAVRLEGQLNVEALQQSFNEIISRHEVLRTNFQTREGQPVAIISEEKPLTLQIFDISKLPSNQQEAEIKQEAAQEAQQSFDISKDHLLRVKLLRLGEQEHIVLLTMHHIVSDGWSISVLVQELATLYQSFCNGQPSPLSELAIQYVDFAAWQRQWLQGEVLETQISYWLKHLENAPKILELPTDYPRPAIQTFRGATYSFKLSPELSASLNKLSQQQGSTLFMTLLAGFQTLLWRYTGSEDIVVGSPIANRNRIEIERLIGFFVNTLVLRTNLAGNPSFEELLKRVREVALGAYTHQDLPFELLVEQLQPQRDLSHTPLFQVMFVLQNAPMSALELSGLTLTPLESNSDSAKFDLNLQITEIEEGLLGSIEYNTDLFEDNTIHQMASHLQTLLEGIVANPQQRLSELPLLSESERHQLVWEWNNTEVDYPQQQCIHQLFEGQVELTPDAVAVIFENQQLTYRELNNRANLLAHYLRSLGVKSEVLVGICVERSSETLPEASLSMVIGLLAILKAGGAYIPIDPNYPQERIAFILEDTQAPVLLTQSSLRETIPQHKAQVICLDTDWHLIAQQSQKNVISEITPDNLAYIIYTSGSTGKPKGVMIKHASTVAMLDWAKQTFAIEALQGVLASTSICFDLSVFELFIPLCCGGKVILIENALYLSTLPTAQNVTLINTVPSVISQLLRTDSIPASVQTINVAGEPLHHHLVQQLYQQENIQQVFNLYGPSEDTTYSTFALLDKDTSNIPPIGRPIHNTQIYLLDQNLQPVPVGVTGMLYIGGAGLSRGYLNKPELTAERFIPNPYTQLPGERLYQTGDLARYLANGEIEYIGRIDYQVKVRGFRIELLEIEALIIEHPEVREAVVTVDSSETDSQRIIAYVVPNSEERLTISQLRDFLEAKLPNYMVPTAFVFLEALPLTPNGKIDRKALKAPDTARPEDQELVAPRNFLEAKLAEIWAGVLGVDKVGIFDNFFELGGDSILAIVVITRANQAGLKLTVKQLFQHQTVVGLASVAVTKNINQAEQELITGLVSLTPIQSWFFEQNLLEPHHWNQAVLLEVKQLIDLALLEKSVQQLLVHHDVLRLRFEETEFGYQQIIASPDAELPLINFDFSALSAGEQKLAIETAATKLQASLNLSTGPLMRVALFNLGRGSNRLLILIHHLAVDGVSWRILLEDLDTTYQMMNQGKKIELPAKTTSFKYWSKCLEEYAQSATFQQEWDYWLRESWQNIAPLPVDFSDGDNTVASTLNISICLTVEQTQALLKEVPKVYNTQINDVLLTALVQAFSQWTGNNSLLLALEGHGREEIFDDVDLSRTVGWFTSVFPVLLGLGKTSHPVEALKAIKEQLRSIPNKGIGYGVLRYLSQDIARVKLLRSLPQAEVVFNYLGQFDQTFSDSSIFKISQDSQGQTRSSRNRESYMLSIDALVIDNQLRIDWTYSEKIHQRSTIERLAQEFLKALQVLVTHCQSPEVRVYTPSDFPEAELSQQDLERFLRKIN